MARFAYDVVQECFLALLRNPRAYDAARAPLRPFLLAMARNQVRKRWRTEWREECEWGGSISGTEVTFCLPGKGVALALTPGPAFRRSGEAREYADGARGRR
jgi:DNA-directed RNA polymerase specialized sigma24 family protein